jgi:transcriptional regulator with XRE-family HTH domain
MKYRQSRWGRRIRAYREQHHLTQAQFGERCGLSAIMVSLLERGETRRPQLATLAKLRTVLDAEPETAAEAPTPQQPITLEMHCQAINALGFAVTLSPLAPSCAT